MMMSDSRDVSIPLRIQLFKRGASRETVCLSVNRGASLKALRQLVGSKYGRQAAGHFRHRGRVLRDDSQTLTQASIAAHDTLSVLKGGLLRGGMRKDDDSFQRVSDEEIKFMERETNSQQQQATTADVNLGEVPANGIFSAANQTPLAAVLRSVQLTDKYFSRFKHVFDPREGCNGWYPASDVVEKFLANQTSVEEYKVDLRSVSNAFRGHVINNCTSLDFSNLLEASNLMFEQNVSITAKNPRMTRGKASGSAVAEASPEVSERPKKDLVDLRFLLVMSVIHCTGSDADRIKAIDLLTQGVKSCSEGSVAMLTMNVKRVVLQVIFQFAVDGELKFSNSAFDTPANLQFKDLMKHYGNDLAQNNQENLLRWCLQAKQNREALIVSEAPRVRSQLLGVYALLDTEKQQAIEAELASFAFYRQLPQYLKRLTCAILCTRKSKLARPRASETESRQHLTMNFDSGLDAPVFDLSDFKNKDLVKKANELQNECELLNQLELRQMVRLILFLPHDTFGASLDSNDYLELVKQLSKPSAVREHLVDLLIMAEVDKIQSKEKLVLALQPLIDRFDTQEQQKLLVHSDHAQLKQLWIGRLEPKKLKSILHGLSVRHKVEILSLCNESLRNELTPAKAEEEDQVLRNEFMAVHLFGITPLARTSDNKVDGGAQDMLLAQADQSQHNLVVDSVSPQIKINSVHAADYPLLVSLLTSNIVQITNLVKRNNNCITVSLGDTVTFVTFLTRDLSRSTCMIRLIVASTDERVRRNQYEMVSIENLKPFDDREMTDLSQWSIQKSDLSSFHGLSQALEDVRVAHMIDNDHILVQTSSKLLMAKRNCELAEVVASGEPHPQALELASVNSIRSLHCVYLVESDRHQKVNRVIKFDCESKTTQTVITIPKANILAIQLNYDHLKTMELDSLFVFDGKSVTLWRQTSVKYQITQTYSLAEVIASVASNQRLQEVLADKEFVQASISSRCISIKCTTFVYETGYSFDSVWKQSDDSVVGDLGLSSVRLGYSDKQVHCLERFDGSRYLVTKHAPATRRCSTVGLRQQVNVQSCALVSTNLVLMKIQRQGWVLFNANGTVQALPPKLKRILDQDNWLICESKVKSEGHYQTLLFHDNRLAVVSFSKHDYLLACQTLRFQINYTYTQTVLSDFEGKNFVRIAYDPNCFESINLEADMGDVGGLITLVTGEKYPTVAIVGKHVCLVQVEKKRIQVTKIDSIRRNECDDSGYIDLKDIWTTNDHRVLLQSCSRQYGLHWLSQASLDMGSVHRSEQLLQVFVLESSRMLIYDLEQADLPIMTDISATNQSVDPERYVFSGCEPSSIQPNHACSLYLHLDLKAVQDRFKDWDLQTRYSGIYRPYSELDLQEARRLQNQQSQFVKQFDTQALFSSIDGQSLFSLFEGDIKLFQAIRTYLEVKLGKEQVDENGEPDFSDYVRLLIILMQTHCNKFTQEIKSDSSPSVSPGQPAKSTNQYTALFSILVQRNLKNVEIRDIYLKLLKLNPFFSVSTMLRTTEELEQMLSAATPLTIELFNNNCFHGSRYTSMIQTLQWPHKLKAIQYTSNKIQITEAELNEVIEKRSVKRGAEGDKMIKAITVRVADFKWFLSDRNGFIRLAEVLTQSKSQAIFTTEFVRHVIDYFWLKYKKVLLLHLCLPYIACLVATIYYFWYALERRNGAEQSRNETFYWRLIFAILSLVLLARQIYCEVVQFWSAGSVKKHFQSIWNFNDAFWLLSAPTIVLLSVPDEPYVPLGKLVTMSSLVSFSMMVNLFQWMRLFETTAFYIELIIQTFSQILPFMIVLLLGLTMFGIPMIILNMNRTDATEELVIEEHFDMMLANLFINQYLLALGEFAVDGFSQQNQAAMCYIFFLLASFSSQVIMLNMLIAIMGDKYEQVIENYELNSTKSKLETISEYAANIYDLAPHKEQQTVFYIVTPDEDGDEGITETWEGSIKQMSKMTEKKINAMEQKLSSAIAKQQTHSNQKVYDLKKLFETKLEQQRAAIEYKIDRLQQASDEQTTAVEAKLDENRSVMDKKIDMLQVQMQQVLSLLQSRNQQKFSMLAPHLKY